MILHRRTRCTDKLPWDIPEVIETSKLYLKVPKAGDGEVMHAAMIDGYQDYVMWLNWPEKLPTVEQTEIRCRHDYTNFILRQNLRYMMICKKTNQVVGYCACVSYDGFFSVKSAKGGYFYGQ